MTSRCEKQEGPLNSQSEDIAGTTRHSGHVVAGYRSMALLSKSLKKRAWNITTIEFPTEWRIPAPKLYPPAFFREQLKPYHAPPPLNNGSGRGKGSPVSWFHFLSTFI